MLVPFVPPVISCFSSRFSLRKSPTLSAKINAVLFLSLTTLTACGGSDSTEPAPTPKDTIAPVITLIGNTPLTHSIDTSYDDEGATANDATDGNVDVTMTGSVDSTIVNSYTLTYTATDTAGNKSTSTRIVNVIDDVAPVITLGGSSEVIHPVGTAYIDASATATDNVDEAINVISTGAVDVNVMASYTITYTASDEAENEATAVVRTVNVVDLTAPVISLNGESVIEQNYGDDYTDAGATANDNIDGVVTAPTTDTILTDKIGSYGITYTATDAAGNVSTLERIVNVADLAGPVIILTGGNTITLGKGRVYKELGATALDNLDGEIAVGAPTGIVDYDNIGTYELTYTVEDNAKNVSTIVRTVDVVAAKAFITTWKSDNPGSSNSNQIKITTNPEFTSYNYTVDWGDGETSVNIMGDITHTYTTESADKTYTISISGDFPQLYQSGPGSDSPKLLTIEQWGDGALLSLKNAFMHCSNLVSNAIDTPNLRFVTDMSSMFEYASLFNSGVNYWDVSSVENMNSMFSEASTFNQDISSWNVNKVTDMRFMFSQASSFNQNLGAWDVTSVSGMDQIFFKTPLSTENFDALLQAWSVKSVKDNVTFHGGVNAYSTNSQAARDTLTGIYSWTIDYGPI